MGIGGSPAGSPARSPEEGLLDWTRMALAQLSVPRLQVALRLEGHVPPIAKLEPELSVDV